MNAILRHYALRLFSSAFLGALICLALLPYLQGVPIGNWVTLLVTLILVGCFWSLGWSMNRLGLLLIRRQAAESAVWERAGMAAEAQNAFERIKALFDSFWLSGPARRRHAPWITRRLARFYLTQARPTREGLSQVMTYLRLHPRDEAVALGWLEALLHRESVSAGEQETAARLSEALADHEAVQRLLMQFFLNHRRVDFEALQTYRRVWQSFGGLAQSTIRELGAALLSEAFIDDWALQVYLKAYSLGETDCLEGVAAGLQFMRPNADNERYLASAREIIQQLDADRRRELIRKFSPPPPVPHAPAPERAEAIPDRPFAAAGRKLAGFGRAVRSMLQNAVRRVHAVSRPAFSNITDLWRRSPKVRRAVTTAIVVGACGIMIALGWQWLGTKPPATPPSAPPPRTQPLPPPVTDPFTIQVAAYLKPEDAQRFVDQLRRNQIEAFASKAVSANRTWYQVKVSHFATKADAVRYGEMLKTKGLIDDFYVANYNGGEKMKDVD